MGKITQNEYGKKWVKIFCGFRDAGAEVLGRGCPPTVLANFQLNSCPFYCLIVGI
jgi:hypothetical protein